MAGWGLNQGTSRPSTSALSITSINPLAFKNKTQPLNAQPGSVISVVRKHVSANKTFILFVNRLLNKVNITVIEGKTHPSKCHVHTMPEHRDEREKVAWHPTVLRCQTSGQRGGCADCPRDCVYGGFLSRLLGSHSFAGSWTR